MLHTIPFTGDCFSLFNGEDRCQSGRCKHTLRSECRTDFRGTRAFLGRLFLPYIIRYGFFSSVLSNPVVEYVVRSYVNYLDIIYFPSPCSDRSSISLLSAFDPKKVLMGDVIVPNSSRPIFPYVSFVPLHGSCFLHVPCLPPHVRSRRYIGMFTYVLVRGNFLPVS